MITELQKQEILALIEIEAKAVGSYNKLANKLGISSATISYNLRRPDHWKDVSDELWMKVGGKLGYRFKHTGWQVVDTENYRIMQQALKIAQQDRMFVAISENSGSGKSSAIKRFKATDTTDSVYVLECGNWGRQRFLVHLAGCLGVKLETERLSSEVIGDRVMAALQKKAAAGEPLVILDQANSLRPTALTWLIHLYNKLEGEIGVVVCGTEHLKDSIKKGVRRHDEGYDELESRLGRSYISLLGYTRQDVENMAIANGLNDAAMIDKVWLNCEPKEIVTRGKYVTVVRCGRALQRKIIAFTKLN